MKIFFSLGNTGNLYKLVRVSHHFLNLTSEFACVVTKVEAVGTLADTGTHLG